MADTYLNVIGKPIKLVDNGDGTFSLGAAVQQPYEDYLIGTATGGTTTTLIDETKDIETGSLVGKVIKMTIGGVDYIRTITENVGNEIKFLDTFPGAGAIATLGSGKDAEGQVKISVAEGTGGDYTVQFVPGTGVSSAAVANFDTSSGLLTIVSPTDIDGKPVGILPGNLQGIIDANEDAKGIFTVDMIVEGVPLPTSTEVLTFTDDEVTVGTGLPAEGRVSIACKGDLIGTVGNEYSVEVVQGTETTNDDVATLNPETKVLTITVNLDGSGQPRTLAAGSLETLLANTDVIKDKFVALPGFTADPIPVTTEPVPFNYGSDHIPVVAGTNYAIF